MSAKKPVKTISEQPIPAPSSVGKALFVEYGDDIAQRIEVTYLTVGNSLKLSRMIRAFVPLSDHELDADENAFRAARLNFIGVAVQTVAGAPIALPTEADSPAEFERKFESFLALDNELVARWIVATNDFAHKRTKAVSTV